MKSETLLAIYHLSYNLKCNLLVKEICKSFSKVSHQQRSLVCRPLKFLLRSQPSNLASFPGESPGTQTAKTKPILKWEFVSGSWKLAYEYSHLSSLLAARGEECSKKAVFSGQLDRLEVGTWWGPEVGNRQLETHIECFHSRGQHVCKFIEKKKAFA